MNGLRNIREAKLNECTKYTQEAVAKAAGITAATLRAYEKDPSKMRRETAERIAAYLGVPVEDIFLAA